MRPEIAILREEARAAQSACDRAKGKLVEAVRSCRHKWGKTVYDPIREEGYLIPGDPPGVGGSDHRSDFYVEAKTTPRWRRTCELCGETEETKKTWQEVTEHPKF